MQWSSTSASALESASDRDETSSTNLFGYGLTGAVDTDAPKPPPGGKRVVGPAVPDAALLAQAQAQALALARQEEEDEEDDDVVGPSLGDTRQAVPDHM